MHEGSEGYGTDQAGVKEEEFIQKLSDAFASADDSGTFRLSEDFGSWAKIFADKPEDNSRRLFFSRHTAWCLQGGRHAVSKGYHESAREVAYEWLRFLLGPAREGRSFFLQHVVVGFKLAFYLGGEGHDLRPKPRRAWENRCGRLKFLKRPENLTILEMEIALAIFEWNSDEPRLVWWIREYPHILRRVHQVLLGTYGFTLLKMLRRAMKAARSPESKEAHGADLGAVAGGSSSLYKAPYLASVGWRLYPRLGGLVTIGLLGIFSINYVLTPFYAAPLSGVALVGFIALVLIIMLILMDVFKQNRGVLVSPSHALPRVIGVLWRVLAWGAFETSATVAVLLLILSPAIQRSSLQNWVAYHQLPDMALPHLAAQPWWHWLVRFTVLGLAAVLLGLLLQWFWEDRSVIEPI